MIVIVIARNNLNRIEVAFFIVYYLYGKLSALYTIVNKIVNSVLYYRIILIVSLDHQTLLIRLCYHIIRADGLIPDACIGVVDFSAYTAQIRERSRKRTCC